MDSTHTEQAPRLILRKALACTLDTLQLLPVGLLASASFAVTASAAWGIGVCEIEGTLWECSDKEEHLWHGVAQVRDPYPTWTSEIPSDLKISGENIGNIFSMIRQKTNASGRESYNEAAKARSNTQTLCKRSEQSTGDIQTEIVGDYETKTLVLQHEMATIQTEHRDYWNNVTYTCDPFLPSGYPDVVGAYVTLSRLKADRCPKGFAPKEDFGYTSLLMPACLRRVQTESCGSNTTSPRLFGNPITATGSKVQKEIDYPVSGNGLFFGRIYNSTASATPNPIRTRSLGLLQTNWTASYQQYLELGDPSIVTAWRADGVLMPFKKVGNSYQSPIYKSVKLWSHQGEGYFLAQGEILETYDSNGRLKSIHRANGAFEQVAYAPAGQIQVVEDHRGRKIQFNYAFSGAWDQLGVLSSVTLPGGDLIEYTIGLHGFDKVKFPDNATRRYIYTSMASTYAPLTGLVDESNQQVGYYDYTGASTLAYNTRSAGNINSISALSSRNAHGVGDVQIYDNTKNPLVMSSVRYEDIAGAVRQVSATQPAGAGCAASISMTGYDSTTGNVAYQDDFNGKRTCYAYDAQSRESTRIEGLLGTAAGTVCSTALDASSFAGLPAETRKISTQWHPHWQLETRRAEPGKITTWVYNGQPDPFSGGAIASCTSPMYGATSVDPLPDGKPIAVLCKQVIQSTTDVNGSQGFSATLQPQDPAVVWPQVTSHTTSYTYNQYGQVLTSTDERGQVTTYAYYPSTTATYTKGDLWKVTNALGHVTEYTQYNPHGQVLQAKDPNGVITSYTYDLRQRLTSVTQAGQLTQIDWWPTGLLKKVTQPDGSWLFYDYDDAHRLTDIADNLGNAVHYELDNAGNRKQEQVKDSSGVLTRQIDRNYDALNRLWKTSTGAAM